MLWFENTGGVLGLNCEAEAGCEAETYCEAETHCEAETEMGTFFFK